VLGDCRPRSLTVSTILTAETIVPPSGMMVRGRYWVKHGCTEVWPACPSVEDDAGAAGDLLAFDPFQNAIGLFQIAEHRHYWADSSLVHQ
jgi:hypothetical protein